MAQKKRRSRRDPDDREQIDDEPEEVEAEGDDDYEDEYEDEDAEPDEDDEEEAESDEESDPVDDFEAEMHELQEELGDEWVLRFSVQGGDAWLTAEKTDGSQHVEAPTAEVLLDAVELLDKGGGQSE